MKKERESDREQIGDDDLLYRRFHPQNIRRDGRISYALYLRRKPPPPMPDPEISVDLARLTTPEKTLAAAQPIFGLATLRVGDVRRLGFTVRYQPSQNNRAHCIIEGVITETDCARLAEITRVHIPPPGKSTM